MTNTALSECSLWITVARTDIPFMMQTIPHLVRMCDYPFRERVLAIDSAPLSGDKPLRPGVGSMEELRRCCGELIEKGAVDSAVDIDCSESSRRRIYKKYFGTGRIKATHNWKGYPVFGSMYCIEKAKGEYFLHFDSDMLLYQQKGFSWIAEGIKILNKYPEVLWVRPLSGPQSEKRNIYLNEYKASEAKDGFYKLGWFSSRCYLIDRKRFEKILPLKVLWALKQGKIKDKMPRKIIEALNFLTGSGILESWEVMVGSRMQELDLFRADIADERAWTLHPHERGKDFIQSLPAIIEKIEKGWFPAEQAGNYDLQLEHWIR